MTVEGYNDGETFHVGDILYTSWGWEQTNVDFYEVTRETKASIWVRQIHSVTTEKGPMCGDTVPVLDPKEYISPEIMTRRSTCRVSRFEYLYKWDGTPRYTSWYG